MSGKTNPRIDDLFATDDLIHSVMPFGGKEHAVVWRPLKYLELLEILNRCTDENGDPREEQFQLERLKKCVTSIDGSPLDGIAISRLSVEAGKAISALIGTHPASRGGVSPNSEKPSVTTSSKETFHATGVSGSSSPNTRSFGSGTPSETSAE